MGRGPHAVRSGARARIFPSGREEKRGNRRAGRPRIRLAVEAEPERLRLVISVHTVERHLATIYRKIGVRNRTEATAFAYKSGLANT